MDNHHATRWCICRQSGRELYFAKPGRDEKSDTLGDPLWSAPFLDCLAIGHYIFLLIQVITEISQVSLSFPFINSCAPGHQKDTQKYEAYFVHIPIWREQSEALCSQFALVLSYSLPLRARHMPRAWIRPAAIGPRKTLIQMDLMRGPNCIIRNRRQMTGTSERKQEKIACDGKKFLVGWRRAGGI